MGSIDFPVPIRCQTYGGHRKSSFNGVQRWPEDKVNGYLKNWIGRVKEIGRNLGTPVRLRVSFLILKFRFFALKYSQLDKICMIIQPWLMVNTYIYIYICDRPKILQRIRSEMRQCSVSHQIEKRILAIVGAIN